MGFGGLLPATCCPSMAEGPEGFSVGHLAVCGLRHFPAVAQAAGPSLGGGWPGLPPSLLSLLGLTPSFLPLQTPPPALNPDLGVPLPQMSRGHHKSPALSPPLRLALASAQVLGRDGVTWDSCVFCCSEVTWGSGQIKAPPTDITFCVYIHLCTHVGAPGCTHTHVPTQEPLGVHASAYPCRSPWVYTHPCTHTGTPGCTHIHVPMQEPPSVHTSAYPRRSLWPKCQAVLSLGTGQLWVASIFPHIIL